MFFELFNQHFGSGGIHILYLMNAALRMNGPLDLSVNTCSTQLKVYRSYTVGSFDTYLVFSSA